MAGACVSCSDQWKVRDQDKNLLPIHWGITMFLCSREFWIAGSGVSLWCNATPEEGTILGGRACPSPSHLSHTPQPVQGGRETSGSGYSTSATEQNTHDTASAPASPHSPFDEGTFVCPPSQHLDAHLVTSLPWYPCTWQQACLLWPVSQERAIQTSLCIRQAAPEGKDIIHPWQCDCNLF